MSFTNPSSDSTGDSESIESPLNGKYEGLIPKSYLKILQKEMFLTYFYIINSVRPYSFLVHIFSFIRFAQFIGPIFFEKTFYNQDSYSDEFLNFISIFFHFCPPSIRLTISDVLLYCHFSFMVIFTLAFIICSTIFNAKKSLPKTMILIIDFIVSYVLDILQPMMIQTFGEYFGRFILEKESKMLIPLILGLIGFILYFWLLKYILSSSLLFRPSSIQTLFYCSTIHFFLFNTLQTFVIAFGSVLPQIPRIIFIGIGGCSYLFSWILFHQNGGLIFNQILFASLSWSGFTFCIFRLCCDFLNYKPNEIYFLLLVVIFLIFFFINYKIDNWRNSQILSLLDMIEEESDSFDLIQSHSQFFSIVLIGFKHAHPVCTSWKLNRWGIEFWPQESKILIIFARFVAIYPEEKRSLISISEQMRELTSMSIYCKHLIFEIQFLFGKRESHLTIPVQKQISVIQKMMYRTIVKIQNIWNCILQENNHNLEFHILETMKSFERTEKIFNQILRQYPNNRFIYQLYSSFLRKVSADHVKYTKIKNKIRNMHQSTYFMNDDAHSFGINAFPNLPALFSDKSFLIETEIRLNQENSENVDNDLNNIDHNDPFIVVRNFKERINKIKFPGIKFHRISYLMLFIIGFFLPFLIFQAILPTIRKKWQEPFQYIHNLSFLQFLILILTSLNEKYSYDEFNITNRIIDQNIIFDASLSSYSLSSDLKVQASYYLDLALQYFQKFNSLRNYKIDDPKYAYVRKELFENEFEYQLFENFTVTRKFFKFSDAFLQHIRLNRALFDMNLSAQNLQFLQYSSEIWNVVLSSEPMSLQLFTVRNFFLKIMDESYQQYHSLFISLMIGVYILYPLVNIVILLIIYHKHQHDQEIVYKVFSSIPKHHISSIFSQIKISSSLYSSQLDLTSRSLLGYQTENLIRVFNNINDESSTPLHFFVSITLSTICIIACHMIASYLLIIIYDDSLLGVESEGQHLSSFMSSCSYQLASSGGFYTSIGTAGGAGPQVLMGETNNKMAYERLIQRINISTTFYNQARFGFHNVSIGPFVAFSEIVNLLNKNDDCSNGQSIPKSFQEAYQCLTTDMKFTLVFQFIQNMIVNFMDNQNETMSLKNPESDLIWDIQFNFLLKKLYLPKFLSVINDVINTIVVNAIPKTIGLNVVFVLSFFIFCLNFYFTYQKEKELRFALCMLLYLDPSVIFQNFYLNNILSNNFHVFKSNNTFSFQNSQFEQIAEKFPDGMIIVDETNGNIISMNQAALSLFSFDKTQNISDLFKHEQFNGTAETILDSNVETLQAIFKNDYNLMISKQRFDKRTVYSILDITQQIRYNNLIEAELERSNNLLTEILPPQLVDRVKSGEKNISFSVQSCSVVFLDIVEFTPWCGSTESSTIMTTLNHFYHKLDQHIKSTSTMIRVKLIGDCYMAAGGIFQEQNQPVVHAQEAVNFGLEAISIVKSLNQEKNMNLKIRVGIHTGGPIVAGVIGLGKPTFEILGPTILIAHEMEHQGDSMQVQISHDVYQLIYGSNFIVVERGNKLTKNGQILAYFVTGKKIMPNSS
ncbi:MAG: hypothetical protein Ta2E_10730 [Mycoplasmoidaceae bacterium]|nr:MAG: hypothetical protein Ta2E_10730 [Mycoplasmoidaceae bacterium]